MKETFLDHGFVELIDHMGDDHRILQAARVSTGGDAFKTPKADRGLIRYLFKNKHMSPFEQVSFTFHAKVPNFVMKQFLRHRTFKFNEYSQRYSEIINDYYVPEDWRIQGETNHQGSGKPMEPFMNAETTAMYQATMDMCFSAYDEMIAAGIAKEMARMVIPSSVYTECYFTVDFRNLLHMMNLRQHEHAQYEIKVFADAIFKILINMADFRWTMEIYNDMTALDWYLQELLTSKIEPHTIINHLEKLTEKE